MDFRFYWWLLALFKGGMETSSYKQKSYRHRYNFDVLVEEDEEKSQIPLLQ